MRIFSTATSVFVCKTFEAVIHSCLQVMFYKSSHWRTICSFSNDRVVGHLHLTKDFLTSYTIFTHNMYLQINICSYAQSVFTLQSLLKMQLFLCLTFSFIFTDRAKIFSRFISVVLDKKFFPWEYNFVNKFHKCFSREFNFRIETFSNKKKTKTMITTSAKLRYLSQVTC